MVTPVVRYAPAVRIHCIVARNAPVAAVLRRGPSKVVQVLKWNLTHDTFEAGQWFRGRLYEHRCDLSPSGSLLLYFAAKRATPFVTWTAVSRLPYLTALALWPKGDSWGGGGLFDDEHTVRLHHQSTCMELAPGFSVPDRFTVLPFATHAPGDANEALSALRLRRDGWTRQSVGKIVRSNDTSGALYRYDPPQRWVKDSATQAVSLTMELLGFGQPPQGPWRVQRFTVTIKNRDIDLGACDWADLLANGDVLFARDGAIYRIRHRSRTAQAQQLIDLKGNAFTNVETPPWAQRWSVS